MKQTLFCILLLALFACKKEEKIALADEKAVVEGTWYSSGIRFRDVLNGTLNADVLVHDEIPLTIINDYDNLPAQIRFNADGSYSSVSHDELLFFAIPGNIKKENTRGGTWQVTANGKIQFDKGYYEFNSLSPRIFSIIKRTSDSLVLETTDPSSVYEWAFIYGASQTIKNDLQGFFNICSNPSGKFGGLEFARKYGAYDGYLQTAGKQPVTFNAFGLGLRKGSLFMFHERYSNFSQLAPVADSCYRAYYPDFVKTGKTDAQNQISNFRTREQKLTFYFSRN